MFNPAFWFLPCATVWNAAGERFGVDPSPLLAYDAAHAFIKRKIRMSVHPRADRPMAGGTDDGFFVEL
jgi:hypothetical protein